MNSFKGLRYAMAFIFSISVALGQGTVNFRNNVVFATAADRFVRDVNGALLVGTDYLAQLYYAGPSASEMDLHSVSHDPARFRPPGTIQPGTWDPGDISTRVLEGFVPGETVSLQVRVWDSLAGATWESASLVSFAGTQHGASAIFAFTIPPEACQAPTCYYMDNLRGFMLVPEPTVIALAVLGAGGFLLLRRRK